MILMRTFWKLYTSDNDKSQREEDDGYILLASVCSHWRLTLAGWPQSPTPQWLRHQLRKQIEREYTYTLTHTVVMNTCIYLY